MSSESIDLTYKIIIIGDPGVGKTCFFLQFTDGKFLECHNSTVGVEFGFRVLNVLGKNIKLELWDTAGQETFRSITRSFYRKANGVLLMYDITRVETFQILNDWMSEIKTHTTPDVTIVLVGNMLDLADEEREVKTSDAENFCSLNGLDGFFEASARTCENVVEAFTKVSEILVKKRVDVAPAKSSITPMLIKDNKEVVSKRGCC